MGLSVALLGLVSEYLEAVFCAAHESLGDQACRAESGVHALDLAVVDEQGGELEVELLDLGGGGCAAEP